MSAAGFTFEALTEGRIAHITEACTLCGKCFEACPMVPYSSVRGAEPEAVVRSVIGILNDRPYAPEGAVWAETCQKSGVCIEACPEDVNPREMLVYAKLKLQRERQSPGERAGASRDYFQLLSRTIRLMSALQLEPGLWRRLTAVHGGKKEKADAVFYFGCNILQTPHLLLSCMDVFDRMGPFAEIDGGEDDEFHYRLRDAGGRILLTPAIRSTYYARRSYWELARQYFGYGQAKVVVLSRHPRQTRLRQLVPSAFVLALLASAIVAFFGGLLVLPLAVLGGAYVTASLATSFVVAQRSGWRHVLRLPLAFACMHFAYGLGFFAGLLRRGLGQPVATPREAEAP